jgi:cobalt-precorrin 5A hydrolase / precorrin-3B C17-methyltransferase
VIGLVFATQAGRRHAERLAALWADARPYDDGSVRSSIERAWAECDGVVAFLATGAAVRIVAPLLADKRTDPALVCVDEGAHWAVPVLGGHEGGANALARRVADALGSEPVVTTASDAAGVPSPADLAAAIGGVVDPVSDTAAVMRALLDGERVALVIDVQRPLPALPANVVVTSEPAAPCIVVTDRLDDLPRPAVVIRPPSLAVGLGASRGVAADEVLGLVERVLADARLSPLSVRTTASVDVKDAEPGLVEARRRRGWAHESYPARDLGRIEVPNPSAVVQSAVGTASVAEAAALRSAGGAAGDAELVVAKRKTPMATVAVARGPLRPRGRLAVVGLGPGSRDLLTPRALAELRRAAVLVGLDQYVDQVRDLLRPGTRVLASGLGAEEARARAAVDEATAGHAVALVGSGDAGVYAMASPALEYAGAQVDVVVVPGITALLAAAAETGGAPIGHDHCAISLSDLHTPWDVIERRVRAAAEGDFVVGFYNPRSAQRDWQLPKALAILREHRPALTPVAVVTNATRPASSLVQTTLAELDVEQVGMYSLVLVGSSQSRYVAGRFVTPRGYTWAD